MIIEDIILNNIENVIIITFKDIIEESKYPYIKIVLDCFKLDYDIKDTNIEIYNCEDIVQWNNLKKHDDLSKLYYNGKTLNNNLIKLTRHLKDNNIGYSYIEEPVVIYKENDFFIIPLNFDLIHDIVNDMINISIIEKHSLFLSLELANIQQLPSNKHFKVFYSSIGIILYDYLFTWNNDMTDVENNIKKISMLPLHYILKSCLLEKTLEKKVICYI